MMPHALIIDDNTMNINVLKMLLDRESCTYTAVQLPNKLPEVLGTVEKIDVVFLDLEMPHHDGFDLLHELKASPHLQDAPIIAYTVHTSEIDRARQSGFDGFLGKPLSANDFPNQFERILNGERIWEV
jgi:CheY-like chemotaxis protein